MKKIAMFLCSILLSASLLGSCGMATDSLEIESVNAVYNEETGGTTITIRYLDDIEDPLVFEIPAGSQGVGVDRVENFLNSQNERVLRIYFTDPTMAPVDVPLKSGKDGISINDIEQNRLADGSIELIFKDTDGNQVGEKVVVPAGTKISEIKPESMPDGSIKLKVFYTNNEEPSEFTINAARGVKNISTKLENNQYIITFTYTDGTTEEIAFYRPAAWLSGTGAPDPDAGIDGDFYFDIANKLIYQKYDGVWGNGKGGKDPLVDLTLQAITYTVTFIIGEDVRVAPGTKTEYSIKAGESFAAKKYSVPVPIHNNPDYEFLGWYTVDDEDLLTVNHSNFTDLTPISGDLTLYAHWKKLS